MSSWPHFLQLTPAGLSGASWTVRKCHVTENEPHLGQGATRGVSVGAEASRLKPAIERSPPSAHDALSGPLRMTKPCSISMRQL